MTVRERSLLLWVICVGLHWPLQPKHRRTASWEEQATPDFFGNGRLDEFAQFDTPLGISGDTTGTLYIDTGNHRIRNIHDLRDTVVTVAGTGTAGVSGDAGAATSAELNAPWDVICCRQRHALRGRHGKKSNSSHYACRNHQ